MAMGMDHDFRSWRVVLINKAGNRWRLTLDRYAARRNSLGAHPWPGTVSRGAITAMAPQKHGVTAFIPNRADCSRPYSGQRSGGAPASLRRMKTAAPVWPARGILKRRAAMRLMTALPSRRPRFPFLSCRLRPMWHIIRHFFAGPPGKANEWGRGGRYQAVEYTACTGKRRPYSGELQHHRVANQLELPKRRCNQFDCCSRIPRNPPHVTENVRFSVRQKGISALLRGCAGLLGFRAQY